MPISPDRPFVPLSIAVLTVSDTRSREDDRSGDTLVERIKKSGHRLAYRGLCVDEVAEIQAIMRKAAADPDIDVLITTGGTGITARDVTPEAFDELVDKRLDGFGEIFRAQGFQKIGTSAMQSRACAGIMQKTIVFVLPGSPGACKDGWSIISEMLDNRYRPCNLVEMMPRM